MLEPCPLLLYRPFGDGLADRLYPCFDVAELLLYVPLHAGKAVVYVAGKIWYPPASWTFANASSMNGWA